MGLILVDRYRSCKYLNNYGIVVVHSNIQLCPGILNVWCESNGFVASATCAAHTGAINVIDVEAVLGMGNWMSLNVL